MVVFWLAFFVSLFLWKDGWYCYPLYFDWGVFLFFLPIFFPSEEEEEEEEEGNFGDFAAFERFRSGLGGDKNRVSFYVSLWWDGWDRWAKVVAAYKIVNLESIGIICVNEGFKI